MSTVPLFPNLIKLNLESKDRRVRREREWVGIIIHHTGLPQVIPQDESAWKRYGKAIAGWLSKVDDEFVSAHFLIDRDGEIIQLVNPETHEAFHAGKSSYWHPVKRAVIEDWNRFAIGIELIGDGNRSEYSKEQYKALHDLCRALMVKFPSIHPLAIVGHEQIAPGRKSDPGSRFDWRSFFQGLFA